MRSHSRKEVDANETRDERNNVSYQSSAASPMASAMAEARTSFERAIQDAEQESAQIIERQQNRKRQHELQKEQIRKQESTLAIGTNFKSATDFLRPSTGRSVSSSFFDSELEKPFMSPTKKTSATPKSGTDFLRPSTGRSVSSSFFNSELEKPFLLPTKKTPATPKSNYNSHRNVSEPREHVPSLSSNFATVLSDSNRSTNDNAPCTEQVQINYETDKKTEYSKYIATNFDFDVDAVIQATRLQNEKDEVEKLKQQLAASEKHAKLIEDNSKRTIKEMEEKIEYLSKEKDNWTQRCDELVTKHDIEKKDLVLQMFDRIQEADRQKQKQFEDEAHLKAQLEAKAIVEAAQTEFNQKIAEKDFLIRDFEAELASKCSCITVLEEKLSNLNAVVLNAESKLLDFASENSKLKETMNSINETTKLLQNELDSAKHANLALHNRIMDTESQRDTLSRLLRDLEMKNNGTEEQIKDIEIDLESKCATIALLEDNITKKDSILESAETNILRQNDLISKLKKELEDREAVIHALNTDVATAQEETEKTRTLLSESESHRDSLSRLVCDLEVKRSTLENDLNTCKSEFATKLHELEIIDNDVLEKTSSVNMLTVKIKNLESEHSNRLLEHLQSEEKLKVSIDELTIKIRDLENRNQSVLQERMKSVNGAQGFLESALQIRDDRIFNLENSAAVHSDTISRLRKELGDLNHMIEKQSEEIEAKNQENSRLSLSITQGNQEIDNLCKELNNLLRKNDNLLNSNQKLKKQLNEVSKKMSQSDAVENELDKANKELSILKQELHLLKNKNIEICARMEALKRDRDAENIFLVEKQARAKEDIEKEKIYNASLEKELRQSTQSIEILSRKLDAKENDRMSMEAELFKSRANIEKMSFELDEKEREIAMLLRRFDELTLQNSSLQADLSKVSLNLRKQEAAASASQSFEIQLTNAKRENMELKAKIGSKDDIMKRNERHLQEIQAELHQCQSLVSELQSKLSSEEMANSRLVTELTQVTDRLERMARDGELERKALIHKFNRSTAKLDDQHRFIEQLQADKRQLDDDAQMLGETLKKLMSENSRDKSDFRTQVSNSAKILIEEQNQYIEKLKAGKSQIEDEAEEMKERLIKLESLIQSYKETVPEQENSIDRLKAEKNQLEEEIVMTKDALSKALLQIESLKIKLREYESYIEWLKNQKAHLEDKFQQCIEWLKSNTDHLEDSLKYDAEMMCNALVKLNFQLESDFEGMPKQERYVIDQLNADNLFLEEQIKLSTEAFDEATIQIESNKKSFLELEKYIGRLKSENYRSEDKVKHLEDKVQTLKEKLTQGELRKDSHQGRLPAEGRCIEQLQFEQRNLKNNEQRAICIGSNNNLEGKLVITSKTTQFAEQVNQQHVFGARMMQQLTGKTETEKNNNALTKVEFQVKKYGNQDLTECSYNNNVLLGHKQLLCTEQPMVTLSKVNYQLLEPCSSKTFEEDQLILRAELHLAPFNSAVNNAIPKERHWSRKDQTGLSVSDIAEQNDTRRANIDHLRKESYGSIPSEQHSLTGAYQSDNTKSKIKYQLLAPRNTKIPEEDQLILRPVVHLVPFENGVSNEWNLSRKDKAGQGVSDDKEPNDSRRTNLIKESYDSILSEQHTFTGQIQCESERGLNWSTLPMENESLTYRHCSSSICETSVHSSGHNGEFYSCRSAITVVHSNSSTANAVSFHNECFEQNERFREEITSRRSPTHNKATTKQI